ncbi:MAG: Pr6Pr family membrane protein [Oscillospiraceae bacterium]|jgi:hypothetical protein|nr:Pr6Pr family membrane protein [Oscillospiraceae bacterium]
MKSNRIFALCFRAAAFVLCLAGVLDVTGVFAGNFAPIALAYYTTESNIFVLAVFGILLVRTAAQIKRDGANGRVSGLERLSAIAALAITVTLIIFWGLLAPGSNWRFLISYTNLQLHTLAPILMLADFFLFGEPGKLKRRDPWIFAALPIGYFIQATVLGFSGLITYGAAVGSTEIKPSRFPYFFIDFDLIGAFVFVYVAAISVFFMALAYLFLWIDRRRASAKRH